MYFDSIVQAIWNIYFSKHESIANHYVVKDQFTSEIMNGH